MVNCTFMPKIKEVYNSFALSWPQDEIPDFNLEFEVFQFSFNGQLQEWFPEEYFLRDKKY